MKSMWVGVLAVLLAAGVATPARALDRIYIVRHAEKADGWPQDKALDALWPLSAAGQARAERLAKTLGDAGIAAVYATPTTRALATGLPLSAQVGCPLLTYPAAADLSPVRAFLTQLLQEWMAAKAVLVVAHSNTVPTLLRALGAEPACDADLGIVAESYGPGVQGYDGLWVVEMQGEGVGGSADRPPPEANSEPVSTRGPPRAAADPVVLAGRYEKGLAVASGAYFYALGTPDGTTTRRPVLTR